MLSAAWTGRGGGGGGGAGGAIAGAGGGAAVAGGGVGGAAVAGGGVAGAGAGAGGCAWDRGAPSPGSVAARRDWGELGSVSISSASRFMKARATPLERVAGSDHDV